MPRRKSDPAYAWLQAAAKIDAVQAGGQRQSKRQAQGQPTGRRPIQEIIQQKIAVTENGKTRRLPVIEIALRRLANEAMRGDQPSIKFLLSLLEHYGDLSQTTLQLGEMLAEDAEILAEYLDQTTAADPLPSIDKKEDKP